MPGYLGNPPSNILVQETKKEIFEYLASEGQTVFSGNDINGFTLEYVEGLILIALDGLWLDQADYTASNGTSITLTTPATLNQTLKVLVFDSFDMINVYNKSQSDQKFLTSDPATARAALDVQTVSESARVAVRNCAVNQDPVSQGTSIRSGMSSKIYTGNGTTQDITTGIDMSSNDFGGLTWIKNRDSVVGHFLLDTVRGVEQLLQSDATAIESTNVNSITAFNTDGVSVGSSAGVNTNTDNYVAWNFQTTKRTIINKCTNYNANPDSGLTNVTLSDGEGNATLTRVTDAIELAAAGLDAICSSTYVFKLDASGNSVSTAFAVLSGETTNTNDHYGSVWLRVTGGTGRLDAHGQSTLESSTSITYTKLGAAFTPSVTTRKLSIGAEIGAVVYFVLNQLEESDKAHTIQVIEGSATTYKTNRGKDYISHYNPNMNFSIVGYEGDGISGHEIPHHLGVVPELTIIKNKDSAVSWIVKSTLFPNDDYMILNTTAAIANSTAHSVGAINDVFQLGTSTGMNTNADNYIMYNFASKSSVCKIGKFIGTGAKGNYVSTEVYGNDGFKAAFVLIKNLTSTSGWVLIDTMRADNYLFTDTTGVDVALDVIDSTVDGFVLKSSTMNALNNEYLFMAFSETNVDATKALTDYSYPTISDNISIVPNSLVSVANGFNSNGQVDTQFQFGAGVSHTLGIAFANKHLWLYTDKLGNLGTSEFRPLEGLTRNDADKYGVVSPSDNTLRTSSKHFDYDSPSGVASSSETEFTTFLAYKAFNKDTNDILGNGWAVSTTTTSWLQYKHTEKRILKSWRMRDSVSANQLPRLFTIEGSNDGLNWTAIDSTYTASDYTGNGTYLWGDLQSTSGNTTAYLYHRINITANSGDGTYTQLSELEFNTVIPSDYYLINEGVMYDSTDTPIERVYLAKLWTDSYGDVIRYENLTISKVKINDVGVHGKLTAYGEAIGRQFATALVTFDGSENPPLIKDSFNVKDIVDLGTGSYKIIFETPMDALGYNIVGINGSTNAAGTALTISETVLPDLTGFNIRTGIQGTTYDMSYINVTIFGGKEIK